jgi:hypothetical protein
MVLSHKTYPAVGRTMFKSSAEIGAVSVAIAAIMQWVPPAVALLGLVWYVINIVCKWDEFVAALKSKFTRKPKT